MVRRGTVTRAVLLLSLIAIMFPSLNPPQPVKAITPYPPAGGITWALSEHMSSATDSAMGVAFDGSGVYVAGYDQNTAGNEYEWRVEKRSPTIGAIMWAVSEHISSGSDAAYAVAVDGSGVYVVGYDHNLGSDGWRVEKRSLTTGALIWFQSEHINNNDCRPYGVAVDGSGVYVVGSDENTVGNKWEWRVEKRSLTTGAIMWVVSEHISSATDEARGVAVDASGVYVVGYDSNTAGNKWEWRVEKRSLTTGAIMWAVSEHISSDFDAAYGVAVDGSGIYVVGHDSNTAGNEYEWRVEKRSLTTGAIIWFESEWISSGLSGNDDTSGVAVDGSGVYVVGSDENTVGNIDEWRVEKRSLTTGAIIWAQSEHVSSGYDYTSGVAVDGSGVYVVGTDSNTPGNNYEWRVERRSKPQGDLVSATGMGKVTFTVNNGSLWSLTAKTPKSVSPLPPAGLTFPYGLFDFMVGNLTSGASVNVTLTLPAPLPVGPSVMYWKLHGGVWRQMPANHFDLRPNRTTLILNLTDGATPDDDDGSANGVIVDVGGVAYAYSVPLVVGWNMVSLPVVPVDPTATNMLRSLVSSSKLASVWGYTGTPRVWKYYLPGKASTLTSLNDGYGYWVYMQSADTLYVNGTVIPPASIPPAYALVAGWNLVGFKSQPNATEPKTVGVYLSSITSSYDVGNVWLYDNPSGTWVRADSSYVIQPGQAMWVLVTSPSGATLRP
ncbi:MAG: choice-of-anchor U domain-containing protein [Candidatus Bathyarchaeia archaeon]